MITRYVDRTRGDTDIRAEFKHGYFELSFEGPSSVFVKDFESILGDFFAEVVEDYEDAVCHKHSYEDCFNTMISDFETVNCPYWKHMVGPFNIPFDTSAFEEDE